MGKLLGFLLCCPAFSVPSSSFPFSPPVSRACPCSIACRGYACSSGHLVGQNSCCFCGPGGPSGCKLRVFFSTRCSAMWWACFSSELFVSTMLRYIQATTGCSSKSVDLTSLSYRLPGGSQVVLGLCYSEFTGRCLSYPAGVFQEVSMLIDSTTCVPSRFLVPCCATDLSSPDHQPFHGTRLCFALLQCLSLPYTTSGSTSWMSLLHATSVTRHILFFLVFALLSHDVLPPSHVKKKTNASVLYQVCQGMLVFPST